MFTKEAERSEYDLQLKIYNMEIVNIPRPISYDEKTKQLTMETVVGLTVSDFYGNENPVPASAFDIIRDILQALADNGIEYIDITGYNFMIDNNEEFWIIDVEHAEKKEITNWFLIDFLDGYNGWNPDFL